MAIDRLTSASSLISAIRAEVTRKSDRGTRSEGASSDKVGGKRSRDTAVLRKELIDIVKGVSANDPDAMKSVRPRLVKAVLLWEFGSRLREHGQWQPMLETIVATFEKSDPEHVQLSTLIRELQS